ncbi:MAG: HD domain-containing protein [Betaproteobacteria bacterium]|nr:HD domain-containing protein [Betaproteobacteria bacterium]
MKQRRSEYDVSNDIKTTDPAVVNAAVDRIFTRLYPNEAAGQIDRAFQDMAGLYCGDRPGYFACDTPYHDIQHVLDVTLAMARLIDGYNRGVVGIESLDAPLFRLGIVTALFHDCGYVRTLGEKQHRNGSELTLTHVSRGAQFVRAYLPTIGMGEMADIAAQLIHFTGFETPVADITLPTSSHRLLGSILGSADIIAQMSDRCYLEKCRDRLYPEFVAAGIARKRLPNGEEQVVFESGEDLVLKTPRFYESAIRRLETDFDGAHHHAARHFGGEHRYFEELAKNVQFAHKLATAGDARALKRHPPVTLALVRPGEPEEMAA